MLRRNLLTRPSVVALMTGALVLVACSLLRVAGQPLVDGVPVIAAISTLLVFLIPGAITGIGEPRSFLCNGAILGIVAAVFVTLQSNQFRMPNWSSLLVYEAIGVLACVSVPLCIAGAFGGHFVRWRR
jgi:hypothetical protein